MIETPQIVRVGRQHTAVIKLRVERDALQSVVGTAIAELQGALNAEGVAMAGPLVMHHLGMEPGWFDMELGFPVAARIRKLGRVEPSELPASRAVVAEYRGPYEQLFAAWNELGAWIARQPGLKPAPHLWESYLVGPESTPEASRWITQLVQPLLG